MAPVPQADPVRYSLEASGTLRSHQPSLRRPYHTIILALMVFTSTIAVFDLYLFVSSALH